MGKRLAVKEYIRVIHNSANRAGRQYQKRATTTEKINAQLSKMLLGGLKLSIIRVATTGRGIARALLPGTRTDYVCILTSSRDCFHAFQILRDRHGFRLTRRNTLLVADRSTFDALGWRPESPSGGLLKHPMVSVRPAVDLAVVQLDAFTTAEPLE